ncbi:MAG TPA: sigma-70 family RNA polymerase sigma factor [Thermoanaerobaculia bacterium]|nr:sigma-70 family RNA polymerase sigma factor [Thermoanaerobaculia bacterium]
MDSLQRVSDGGVLPPGDEDLLLARLRAGEEAAFEQLVRVQSGRMLAVARRLLGDEEDARDAVQEAFAAAFRSVAGFAGSCRLSTWLHRIVVNAALMKLRRRRSRPEDAIEDLLPKFREDGHQVDPAVAWEEPVEEMLAREEMCALVRKLVEQLPATYRSVLVLRDFEELPTSEVAEVLEITENAVKIRLHRARQALRTLLDPYVRKTIR